MTSPYWNTDRNKCKKRISRVYRGMRERCYQKNHVGYQFYGEKGIKVICKKDEFISWYLERVPDDMINPQVDRINPKKDYTLSNMQLISGTNNSKKTIRQNPRWDIKLKNMKIANEKRSVAVIIDSVEYESLREAARNTFPCRRTMVRFMEKYKTNNLKVIMTGKTRCRLENNDVG